VQRTVTLILAAVVLLLGAALGGSVVARRLAPERLRAATQDWLSRWLEAPVEIASVRPVFHRGLSLEATGLRSGDPVAGVGVEAKDAVFVLDLRGLLLGGAPVRRVSLAGVRIRVERDDEGAWRPHFIARLMDLARGSPSSGSVREELGKRLSNAVRLVLNAPSLVPSIELVDSQVDIRVRPLPGGADEPPLLSLQKLRLQLVRRLFGGGLRLRAHAAVSRRGAAAGLFEADGELRNSGDFKLGFSVHELDLALLTPLLETLRPTARLAGYADGLLSWVSSEPERHRVEARLRLEDVAGAAPLLEKGSLLSLDLPSLRIHVELEIEPERVRLRDARLAAGSSEVRVGGRLELPPREGSQSFVAVRAWHLPIDEVRDVLLSWLPRRLDKLRRLLAGFEAGSVASFLLSCPRATLGEWRRFAASQPLESWPEDLVAELELSRVSARLPDGRILTDLSGRFVASRERLEVHEALGRLEEKPLPRLDLSLAGFQHLAAARRDGSARAGALPGLTPLRNWLRERRKEDGTSAWSRLDLRADWIDHPLLLWPVLEARAKLRPARDGIHVSLAGARWGGVPIRGEGSIAGGATPRIAATLEAEAPPDLDADPPRANGAWAQGELRAEITRVGRFPSDSLRGTFRVSGERFELVDAEIRLRPQGRVRGDLELDLSGHEPVPAQARFQLEEGSLLELLGNLGFESSGLEGAVVLAADLHGELRPGAPLLAGLQGALSVHARDGTIRRRLPIVIALAEASETFNPLVSRDFTRFRAVDGRLELVDGRLRAESLSLDGPTLRLVATGQVDVVRPPNELEGVVGLFFFRKLDAVIGKVPVLNRLLLGSDENFVAAYFALSGTWAQPEASFIPTKSLATGPGSVVMTLPAFVRRGVEQLQTLLVGGWRVGGEILTPGPDP
jgi:hypothetical protein